MRILQPLTKRPLFGGKCRSEASVLVKGQLLTALCSKQDDHTGQHHGSVNINLMPIDMWWDQA